MSWAWFNKTSVTRGVNLIATITFFAQAQRLPQTSESGFSTGTHTSLMAQGTASSDQTNIVKVKDVLMSHCSLQHYGMFVLPALHMPAVCVCVCVSLSSVWFVFLHYVLWSAAKGLQFSLSVHPTHSHLSPCSFLPFQMLSWTERWRTAWLYIHVIYWWGEWREKSNVLLVSFKEFKPEDSHKNMLTDQQYDTIQIFDFVWHVF